MVDTEHCHINAINLYVYITTCLQNQYCNFIWSVWQKPCPPQKISIKIGSIYKSNQGRPMFRIMACTFSLCQAALTTAMMSSSIVACNVGDRIEETERNDMLQEESLSKIPCDPESFCNVAVSYGNKTHQNPCLNHGSTMIYEAARYSQDHVIRDCLIFKREAIHPRECMSQMFGQPALEAA